MSQIVGVDLGGSWLRIAEVGEAADGPPLSVERVPTPDSWEGLVELLARYNRPHIAGFGLAVSGTVADHATLLQAPNVPWLNGRNLQKEFEAQFGKPVIVSNDMEAATEGELARGALRNYRWAIFDTISTGWGGNLILNGQRVDGEPGHANVAFDVPDRCGAGHVGCLESLYSGSALERKIRKRIDRTGAADQDPWEYFGGEVAIDDPWALSVLEDWGEGVGRAWANVLNRIRPLEAIVYMGTTAENLLALPSVQEKVRATIRTIAMFPEHQADTFPILPAEYADRSLFGAVVVHRRFSKSAPII
jgi:predicted NBD/HSP70 family sugar kinase